MLNLDTFYIYNFIFFTKRHIDCFILTAWVNYVIYYIISSQLWTFLFFALVKSGCFSYVAYVMFKI